MLKRAATVLNENGAGGISLSNLAEELGIKRTALYYYFKDRQALISACYHATCELAKADLLEAENHGATGLEKIMLFVLSASAPERRNAAVLTDVAYLSHEDQTAITFSITEITSILRGFVDQGIQDGSVVCKNPELASLYILGMVWWLPIARFWARESQRHAAADPDRFPRAAFFLIAGGLARDRNSSVTLDIDLGRFKDVAPRAFDRAASAVFKRAALIRAGCHQFNKKGIVGASLEEIAAEAGVTTGALYRYVKNKDELVELSYQRSLELLRQFAREAERKAENGLERAAGGLYATALSLMTGVSPMVPTIGIESLKPAVKEAVLHMGAVINRMYEASLVEGVKDGSIRELDASTMSLVGAGVYVWLSKWRTRFAEGEAERIAAELTEMACVGLASDRNTLPDLNIPRESANVQPRPAHPLG